MAKGERVLTNSKAQSEQSKRMKMCQLGWDLGIERVGTSLICRA
jgi:hypothetical protein